MRLISKMLLLFLILTPKVYANLPYYPIQFPQDQAAHLEYTPYPVSTLTEWWYFNGKLTATSGHQFGYYASYYYLRLIWKDKPLYIPMFMLQLTDVDNKKVYGNSIIIPARNMSVSSKFLNVNFGDGVTLTESGGTLFLKGQIMTKTGDHVLLDLQLTPTKTPMLLDNTGLVDMGDDTNSYYYSMTHMQTHGHWQINNEKYEVVPEGSLSWFDHQWGDFVLTPEKQWIWSSVQLDNGVDINVAIAIDPVTKKPFANNVTATISNLDGSTYVTKDIKIENYLPYGNSYPAYYKIDFPKANIHLVLWDKVGTQRTADLYEGIVAVTGTYHSARTAGFAYIENGVR